jgi:hypothetical protein
MFVPQILRFLDGHREVRPVLGLQVGDEEYQFCRQLMIETALHLAEMDFDLDPYGLWQEHQTRCGKRISSSRTERAARQSPRREAFAQVKRLGVVLITASERDCRAVAAPISLPESDMPASAPQVPEPSGCGQHRGVRYERITIRR